MNTEETMRLTQEDIKDYIEKSMCSTHWAQPKYEIIRKVWNVAKSFITELYEASETERINYNMNKYELHTNNDEDNMTLWITQHFIEITDTDVVEDIIEYVKMDVELPSDKTTVEIKSSKKAVEGECISLILTITLDESLFKEYKKPIKTPPIYPPSDIFAVRFYTFEKQKEYFDSFLEDFNNGETKESLLVDRFYPIERYISNYSYPMFYKYFEGFFNGDFADFFITHCWDTYADEFPERLWE